MNDAVKKLFEKICTGSADEQNDAIGTLVEVLRRNDMRGMEKYAYAFLKPNDSLFKLTLSEGEKIEIVREIDSLIRLGNGQTSRRASLIWALGSSSNWQGLECLLVFLQTCQEQMTDDECYQALCSLDNLLLLGDNEQPGLRALLVSYNIREVIERNATRSRPGLAELAANIIRRIGGGF